MYSVSKISSVRGSFKVICPPLTTLLDPDTALKLNIVVSGEHLKG
jgi:hypothetical protein